MIVCERQWVHEISKNRIKPDETRESLLFRSLSLSLCILFYTWNRTYECWAHIQLNHTDNTKIMKYISVFIIFVLSLLLVVWFCVCFFGVWIYFFVPSFATSIVTVFVLYADIVDHNFYYSSCRFHTYKTKPLVIWQQRRRWASESKRKKKCEKNKL